MSSRRVTPTHITRPNTINRVPTPPPLPQPLFIKKTKTKKGEIVYNPVGKTKPYHPTINPGGFILRDGFGRPITKKKQGGRRKRTRKSIRRRKHYKRQR
jgi:hypothetical protein